MDDEIIIIIDPRQPQKPTERSVYCFRYSGSTIEGISAAIDRLENMRKALANEPRDGS